MGKLRLREVKQPFGNHPARREELGSQNQAAPSPGPQMLHWAGAGVHFRAESTHCKTQVRPRVTGEMGGGAEDGTRYCPSRFPPVNQLESWGGEGAGGPVFFFDL